MTESHATTSPSESVSSFAIFWLGVAATLGVIVFTLITFKNPVLAFGKCVFPYIDLI